MFSCVDIDIDFFCMFAYWNFEHMTVTVTPVHISIMKLCNTCFSVILLKGSSVSTINPIVMSIVLYECHISLNFEHCT
jgi:hypothetical protein